MLVLLLLTLGIQQSVAFQPTSGTPGPSDQLPARFGILPTDPAYGQFFHDVVANPGEIVELSASILNLGDSSVALRVYSASAASGVNGGFVAGESEEILTGSALWVNFPTIESEFPAQSQTDFAFTITVPPDAKPGQYISALVAETVDTVPIPGNEMFDQRMRFAISVGILVPGELSQSFIVGQPSIDRGYLAIPVQNTGNYLVKPQGKVSMKNSSGEEILRSPIAMGSVYAGLPSAIYIDLPDQLPFGNYTVDLELLDPESGTAAELSEAQLIIEEPEDPTGMFLREYSVEPNEKDMTFAHVSVSLDNGGSQIAAANVVLEVSHNGNLVDSFPLTTNQVLLSGSNIITARYIPVDGWNDGNYTFRVIVYSVDPQGGQQVELLNEDLDTEILVP